MNIEPKLLVREAKHSYAVLLGFIGNPDTDCNRMLLKWPDVIDSLLENDEKKFCEDISVLIYQPLVVLAEALAQILRDKIDNDLGDLKLDAATHCRAAVENKSPQEAKEELIRICNTYIDHLRSHDINYEYIKTIKGEKP